MYPYPVHHPYDRYSMVDLDCVDAEEWPAFGSVRGSVCIMEPGDLLFVPQFWWACVQPLNVSLARACPGRWCLTGCGAAERC